MMLHTIKRTQLIKSTLEDVWNFISNPNNLASITPPDMNFQVLSEATGEKMYPGQIIEYRVSPLLGLNLHWVTEITHVKEKAYFVDEQHFGPYRFWHHQHFLKATDQGVEMQDIVHYKLSGGFFGQLAHALFVKKKLEYIFDYRYDKLNEMFTISA